MPEHEKHDGDGTPVVDRREFLAGGRELERLVGNAKAADVGDILAERLMPVDV